MARRPFGPTRDERERDLDRELAFHVEQRVADLVKQGVSATEARRRAVVELGGVAQVQESVRETWIWRGLDTLRRDLRHAVRSLRRSWGFALGAGIILAMAIGANTAVFSVVHAVLLTPLAYPQAERLVAVETLWTNTGQTNPNVSGPDFLDWQAEDRVVSALAHFVGEDEMAITVNGRGGFGNLRRVSTDFFKVFGRLPAAGRLLTPEDAQESSAVPPAVVGYTWAVTHFGTPSDAVGKTFLLYRAPVQIVGVAAPGFQYPDATNIWIPAGPTDRTNRNAANYRVVGRLQEGIGLASARAAMRVVGNRLASQHPDNRFKSVAVIPLQHQLTGHVHGTLWMLMGAVALTFLIGCANLANLLLARSAIRTQEFALRAALGADRWRLVRQILIESGVLTAVAGGVGVLLAYGLVQGLVAWTPVDLPRIDEVRIDGVVPLFALGLSIVSVMLFSLIPALRPSRLDLTDALKRSAAKGAVAGHSDRLRSALVVAEVALSVMLLAGAGLLLRWFQKLHDQDLGFTTDRVVTAYTEYALGDDRTTTSRTVSIIETFSPVFARFRGSLPRRA